MNGLKTFVKASGELPLVTTTPDQQCGVKKAGNKNPDLKSGKF